MVIIDKLKNFSVCTYKDIGSTVDSQAKYDLYLCNMFVIFPVIYLIFWYISKSQDVLIIGKIIVCASWQKLEIPVINVDFW